MVFSGGNVFSLLSTHCFSGCFLLNYYLQKDKGCRGCRTAEVPFRRKYIFRSCWAPCVAFWELCWHGHGVKTESAKPAGWFTLWAMDDSGSQRFWVFHGHLTPPGLSVIWVKIKSSQRLRLWDIFEGKQSHFLTQN